MRPRHLRAVALLGLAFAAGCGGDDGGSAGRSAEEDSAAKAELTGQADAICADAQKPLDVVGRAEKSDVLRAPRQILVSNSQAPEEIAKLERLEPPPALRVRWKGYLDAERALLKSNRAFEKTLDGSQGSAAARRARDETTERGVDANVAARAAGLGTCAKVGVQARHVTRSDEEKVAGDGTFVPAAGVRAEIPEGWGPKYFEERNAQAFDNDDRTVYCAFRRDNFGAPPSGGSEKALLSYAKEQAKFVKSRSESYRLISIQPERAANGSGVSIRRVVDGNAGRIAFFYLGDKRYVVDCNTDEKGFEKADKEVFAPFMRGVTLPDQ